MDTDAGRLLLLLNWMSPAFPTGGFAYSHGLEWAIESGDVQSADDVLAWVADLITRGSGWNDAVLFARCREDDAADLNALALALCASRERYLETTELGRSFLIAAEVFIAHRLLPLGGRRRGPIMREHDGGDEGAAGERMPLTSPIAAQRVPVPAASQRSQELALSRAAGEDEIAYPVVAGLACNKMGIDLHHALLAFLQGFCAAQVSVAVRLVPLGQTAGLAVLRDLMPAIADTAARAATATLDDLGAITLGADIAAMRHETQHSRIFRT